MQRLDPSFGSSLPSVEPPRLKERRSTLQIAFAVLLEQPLIVSVAVIVSTLVSCVALLGLDVSHGASIMLNRMVSATKVVVFLDPKVSPQDAESIGVTLKAQPAVGDIRFRPKEQAFGDSEAKEDVDSRSPDLLLPDAWVLTLQAADTDSPARQPSLESTAERLQKVAAALRGVQFVRFDRRWIIEIDRWKKLSDDLATAISMSILGALFVLLSGIFFLENCALRSASRILSACNSNSSVKVFAYILTSLAAIAWAATLLLHALVGLGMGYFVTPVPIPIQTCIGAIGHSTTGEVLIVAAAFSGAVLAAATLAGRRQ